MWGKGSRIRQFFYFIIILLLFCQLFLLWGRGYVQWQSRASAKCYNTKMFQNLKTHHSNATEKYIFTVSVNAVFLSICFFYISFFVGASFKWFAVFGRWQKNETKQKTVCLQIQVALQRNFLLLVNRMHGQRKLFYFTLQYHKFTHHQWTHLFFSALTDAFDSSS